MSRKKKEHVSSGRKAPIIPYYSNKMRDFLIDPLTTLIIRKVGKTISHKKDDFLMMVVGTPGSGKTDFSLNAYEVYDPEGCSIDYVGLDKEDFANVIQKAKNKHGRRYANYDEANVTRADHASKWNKDLLKLYWAIRGLQIFSNWNNPSAKKTPREFIEERIKAFVFIYEKVTHRPRRFYFFTKEQMIKLYDICNGDLSHKNILFYGREYANHVGWFKQYTGKLREEYDRKKESRMDVVVEKFFDSYGRGQWLGMTQISKQLGYSDTTIRKWVKAMKDDLIENEDYMQEANGWIRLSPLGVDKIYQANKKNYNSELRDNTIQNNKLVDGED